MSESALSGHADKPPSSGAVETLDTRKQLADSDPVIDGDMDYIVAACADELRQLAGKALLVTGGSGFVGRYLVEAVLRFNEARYGPACSVTLIGRHLQVLESRYSQEIQSGDVVLMDWKEAASPDNRRHWDYVVHAAAPSDPRLVMSNPDRSLRDIISTASTVAQIAKKSHSLRAVLISSGAIYGGQPTAMAEIPEDYRGGPDLSTLTSVYGEGKRVSELLFRAAGIDQRVARVFSVIGPYQDMRSSFAAPDLIRQAANNGSIQLSSDGRAVRNYCYAADLAVFLIKLLIGQPRHDVYNVGNRNGTVSIDELSKMVSAIFGGVAITRTKKPRAPSGVPRMYVPRLDRMYELYAPRVGIHEGLWRTCQSVFNRGLIGRRPDPE